MDNHRYQESDPLEGRGAAAWAILATMFMGAAIAALTIYATVVLAAAH